MSKEQGLNSSIEQDQGSSDSLEIQVFFVYLSILGILLSVKYQASAFPYLRNIKRLYIFLLLLFPHMLEQLLSVKSLGPFDSSLPQLPQSYSLHFSSRIRMAALGLWVILAAKMALDYLPELYYSFGSWVIIAAKMTTDYLRQLYYSLGSWVIIAAKMAWDYVRQLYYYLRYQASHVFNSFATLMTRNSTSVEESQEPPV